MRDHEWHEYYQAFPEYFSAATVRDGCQPQKREHADPRGSIVLVHGLSDSPYFMQTIASHFHERHHYNVYLPLLQCHGLKEPAGMDEVTVEEWKRNVAFALDQAHQATPEHVSVGGLSTGGALSFYNAITNAKVNGNLFLFSAALGLLFMNNGLLGRMSTSLLKVGFLQRFLDNRNDERPLLGDDPYKYEYVDHDGALQLVRLIDELNALKKPFSQTRPLPVRVFAAHSEVDDTANIKSIKDLEKRARPGEMDAYYIERAANVTHAGLVLDQDVIGFSGDVKATHNVRFDEMIRRIDLFIG
ncbi:MAG: alpha/beta hydrolase [Proteobacteria bacterium]|nr:alpha/beta hydrolase [Pseudomonadota bacterium]